MTQIKLHTVEKRRLTETGKLVMWRAIEPQWQPGDILSTDAGGEVRVMSVEVRKLDPVLSDETLWAWRVSVEVV